MERPTVLFKWKLDNFLPIKLFKTIGDEKAAVLIIAGSFEIITIKIQQLESSLNRELDKKNIKRTETCGSEAFKDIILEKRNTIGLLENGQLVSFKSFKKFDLDDRLEDIKYFTVLANNDLASITVLRDKVILEIYNNYPRDIDVKRKFDLSWPENEELEASRSSERYCLKLIHIQNPNQFQFFKSLLIEISSDEQDKVLLLSINEKLYWLTPRTEYDDFSIETIKVCSANILEFHFLPELSTLLILEDNNCLSTIYRCPYTNLVKQKAIFLEGTVISYEFLVSQKLFVYSNGFKVFQIQFVIDEILDQIQHVVREVKLSGIVALSYINYLNIFIGISENGLFYKIPIVKHQTQSYAREYFLEVSNQQESINDISKRVFRENERQMETEKKLEDKMIDFRTLATLQKNDRKLGVTATVCYHKNMPDLEEFAVVAKKSCCWLDNNIFVEIWLEVKEDLREDLKNTLKNCMLTVGSGAYTLTSNVKEFNKLQVVLIEKLNEEYPILPNIDLCLNSVFTMRNCSFLVQQNIEICLENLELLAACSGSIQRNISRSQTKIAQVIANLSGAQKVPTKVLVQSTIKVPKSKLKVFLDELGFRDTFYINFCKSSVEVKISDNSIHTQSENAAALLFAKKYLLFKMMPLSIKNLNTDLREGLEAIESSRSNEVDQKYSNLRKFPTRFKKIEKINF